MIYTVVDIETTGGRPATDRITEIAMYKMEDDEVIDEFHSMVNPQRQIPPRITMLTGIDNQMVDDAPLFKELAETIEAFTSDSVFVAHNVNFDYAFLRNEFNRLHLKFLRKKLCTIRLSRKIFPGLPSYSLPKLCKSLEIPLDHPHRAWGDAEATVELFKKVQREDNEGFITHSLNRNSREASLPPHVDKEKFDALPDATGVYFFYNEHGKVVYIGKAKNIRSRVMTHFSSNTNTTRKHRFHEIIHDLSWEETGSEMMACLVEAHAIKEHWPPFNRALKRIRLNWGIYTYIDQNGFGRFAIAQTSKTNKARVAFQHNFQAAEVLRELIEDWQLCSRLSGLHFEDVRTSGRCHDHEWSGCRGACIQEEAPEAYNNRYEAAIEELLEEEATYVLKDVGRTKKEMALVLVENGRYKGFGYAPAKVKIKSPEAIREYLTSGYDDQDIQQILESFVASHPVEKLVFD